MSRQLPEWEAQAVCASADPEVWFPEGKRSPAQAKAICATCPVRLDCLEAAMEAEGSFDRSARSGVWGGLSAGERAQLGRRRRGAAA